MTTVRETRDSAGDGTDDRCVDPSVLAAFIDGTLPPAERAAVEAHLVSCEDCREWLAETTATLIALDESDEVEERPTSSERIRLASSSTPRADSPASDASRSESPASGPPPSEPRGGLTFFQNRWALAGLGVAAALLLAVTVFPRWRAASEARALGALRDTLAQAMTETRTIEPRVDGVGYAPLRVTRSGRDVTSRPDLPVALELASAQAEQGAEASASADALALKGIARLAVRDQDAAIDALSRAAGLAPASAGIASDLAAAYIARGLLRRDRADLTRGLEEARRASSLAPRLAEARFNEALALTRLAEDEPPPAREAARDAARTAWDQYFLVDDNSAWANEGRRLRAELDVTAPLP